MEKAMSHLSNGFSVANAVMGGQGEEIEEPHR